jgi:putative membrane protein
MGAADVVPGVSGGTIAVVLGIYERLLGAIRGMAGAAARLLRGDWRESGRRLAGVDWWLIVPLLVGILGTILLLASVIETQLEERPETMAGLFCGLVLASAVSACRLFEWRGAVQIVLMAVAALATSALLGLQSGPVADPSLLVLAGAGAIAICAMILPGISGAFLLLMLGMYGAVINIVTDLRYVEAAVFLAGAAVGLGLFSTVLGWLLDQGRNTVMAVLVGLMFGSLRVLWPWPNGVGVISRHEHEVISGTGLAWPTAGEWAAPTAAAAVGFAVVLLITRLARD